MSKETEFAKAALELYNDPVLFVKSIFGVTPTEQQAELLYGYKDHGAKISVKSGHGCGKSTSLAWLGLHYLLFHNDCKIPCTAPSSHQLHDILWSEFRKWWEKMPADFKSAIEITTERVYIKGHEQTRYAVARTARKENPEALQGFHATNLLFLIDEASGVDEAVFEVAEGALSTPGSKVIMTANPTRTSGYFFDSHRGKIKHRWNRLHFSCLDSPLVSASYPEDMKAKYGEDSNVYRVRVLGDFPLAGDDAVIPRHWCEKAIGRELIFSNSLRVAGLDVARFGDDKSALVIRQGGRINHIEEWHGSGIDETVGRVLHRFNEGMFDKIYIDAIGIGAGVADILPHHGVPCIGINVAEAPSIKAKFNRLRDEIWWNVREWLESNLAVLPPDLEHLDDLVDELCSPTYKFTPSGKIKIEGKDEMKSRGVDSPNLADALGLALFDHFSQSIFKPIPISFTNEHREPMLL